MISRYKVQKTDFSGHSKTVVYRIMEYVFDDKIGNKWIEILSGNLRDITLQFRKLIKFELSENSVWEDVDPKTLLLDNWMNGE